MQLHKVTQRLDVNDANLSGSSFTNVNLSGSQLEPAQAKALEDILGATLLEHEQLIAAGALGTTEAAQQAEEN